ncbi:hypothetical protein RND71_008205 [Anisodus tanguticus]|uniref:Uncharacterized protein n=1 Tax=Anisodus tanguticus TaxID=243964 RepID=A0AAE1VQF4_9SOLA|nr:hypothetical protein RND71_008205 [Anisodus tanguticus]
MVVTPHLSTPVCRACNVDSLRFANVLSAQLQGRDEVEGNDFSSCHLQTSDEYDDVDYEESEKSDSDSLFDVDENIDDLSDLDEEFKKPPQTRYKKPKAADYGVGYGLLFGSGDSVIERSDGLKSSVPTNIDLDYKPVGLKWKGRAAITQTTTRTNFEWVDKHSSFFISCCNTDRLLHTKRMAERISCLNYQQISNKLRSAVQILSSFHSIQTKVSCACFGLKADEDTPQLEGVGSIPSLVYELFSDHLSCSTHLGSASLCPLTSRDNGLGAWESSRISSEDHVGHNEGDVGYL